MKKIFIVLSVLAALIFSVAPSQALLGMPDDVPGSDILLPFVASIAGMGTVNTLLAVTDVYGATPNFHYTVYTQKSQTVYNDNWKGTKYDIISTDALTIIGKMSPVQVDKLKVDLDGDGTADHYAGYIYFENVNVPKTNSVIAQILIVDIPNGAAASSNAAVKEVDAAGNVESFSANGLVGGAAIGFGLYPRYYIQTETGKTYLVIWKSTNAPAADLHVWFFNADEVKVSSNIPLPNELNIIDVEPYLPVALHSKYAKEGFIQIVTPDTDGAGFDGAREWVGYTWIRDIAPAAALSWDVMTPIHRDAW